MNKKSHNKVIIATILLTVSIIITAGVFAASSNSEPSKAETSVVSEPAFTFSEPTEVVPIDFGEKQQDDSTLKKGDTKNIQEGVAGEKEIVYRIKYKDGKEISREIISESIIKEPIDKIVAIGTKTGSVLGETIQESKPSAPSNNSCDPNYSGVCVPIASDVDCAGGSGNGPAYVSGPVYVIGVDIYDLDRDGNGVGCEN